MPSVSDKQKVAMAIACHDPEKSTSGIPQDVACEFNKADARKRAKRKVKEALEFLGARKMVENVRSMSFTKFLVEDATKKPKRSASDIVADIRSHAHQEAEKGHTAGRAYLKRVLDAEKEGKEEHRLMGVVRARDAYHGAKKEGISFEDSELLLITEKVEVPTDATPEKLKAMIQAGLRAKEIASKLKNPENRTKREGEIAINLRKLRSAYANAVQKAKRGSKEGKNEAFLQTVDAVLTEWEVLEEARKKKKKPSSGLSRKQKSSLIAKARKGKKVFGGHFKDVEKKAAKEYGSKESGEKVAAAAMWKKKARLARESLDLNAVEVDLVVEQVVEYKKMMKKLKKVFERTLTTDMYEDPKVLFETAAAHADDIKGYKDMTDEEKEQFVIDTCVKYELTEAFGDDMQGADDSMGMDDSDAGPPEDQVSAPQSAVSRASFKLEPEEIGKVATYVAQFIDYPPEEAANVPGVMKAIRDLEHADLFHLTPSEVIMARKLLTFGDKYGSQEGQAGGM